MFYRGLTAVAINRELKERRRRRQWKRTVSCSGRQANVLKSVMHVRRCYFFPIKPIVVWRCRWRGGGRCHLILVLAGARIRKNVIFFQQNYISCTEVISWSDFSPRRSSRKVWFSKAIDWLSVTFDVIVFLPCFRAVTVENCHNSTIVLGVTKTAVNIIGCDSCTFFAVCDRISFRFVFTYLLLSVTTLNVCRTLVLKNQFSGSLPWVNWNPKIQGWRSNESTRRPPIWPGLSLLLVLSFAPRGFSSGTPVFPSPETPKLRSRTRRLI